MKKMLIFIFAFSIAVSIDAQTILEKPVVGMNTASGLSIEKIELKDTATVISFHLNYRPKYWVNIPKSTYILPVGTRDTLYVKSTEGIPLAERYFMPESGEVNYKLIFPKINSSVALIDYGESGDNSTWFLYGIQLKPLKTIIPEKLSGNWYRSDNAQWAVSFMDSAAVYKSQVWKCIKFIQKAGLGIISLRNGSKKVDLYIKSGDDKTCMIGESPVNLTKYSSEPDESVIPVDNEEFKMPVFKMDTAIYCGYIKNWTRRYPQKTGMVYVNDILLGSQLPYTFTIADNGSFEVKIPHSNSQIVLAKGPCSYGSVFIEPGKKVFQLIEPDKALFMGDNARVNNDFYKVKDIYSFDSEEMRNKILDFTPEQFKLYCETSLTRDLNKLKEYTSKYKICWKANKLKSMELNYRSAMQLLSYRMNFESVYRTKNKIPNTQRELPVKAVSPDDSYYSFLKPEFSEDPFGAMIPDYYFFINRLKYLDVLRAGMMKSTPMTEIIKSLEKSGVLITPEEKELFRQAEADSYNPQIQKLNSVFSVQIW